MKQIEMLPAPSVPDDFDNTCKEVLTQIAASFGLPYSDLFAPYKSPRYSMTREVFKAMGFHDGGTIDPKRKAPRIL